MKDMSDVQQRCVRWRTEAPTFTPGMTEPTRLAIVAKLGEEAGEVARAVMGEIEGRDGRGDPVTEAAQVVLVLATLVGIHYSDRDLFEAVREELERLERHLNVTRMLMTRANETTVNGTWDRLSEGFA